MIWLSEFFSICMGLFVLNSWFLLVCIMQQRVRICFFFTLSQEKREDLFISDFKYISVLIVK